MRSPPRVSWIIVKVAAEGYLAISLIRPRAVKFTDTRSPGCGLNADEELEKTRVWKTMPTKLPDGIVS